MQNTQEVLELSEEIARRLGEVEGVEAVALGGSWVRDEANPDSDIDLSIYYRSENPPQIENLRLLAQELDDRHLPDAVTDFGEWGPWINVEQLATIAANLSDDAYERGSKMAQRCSITTIPELRPCEQGRRGGAREQTAFRS